MAIGDGVTTCMVCAAPLDAEWNCTRIGSPVHHDMQEDYGFVDAEWYFSNMFHTLEETRNAPPVTFLIKGFLQREGVTAIAAPVRERKSLIALNIAHSLVTGEKLFGHFEVVGKPKRVIYLCPEVSLGPFVDRLRKIGLEEWVNNRFFYRTLSAEGHLRLNDPMFMETLPGSVVFLDTAIRFLDGDENSSKDVRAFADTIFALLKNGAEAVVLLHHSPKSTDDGMMTLENAMRGSGDMGAFLASCWGTRLQDPTDPYKSASFLSNLKQRDFESEDFEVTCGPDCRMHFVDKPGTTVMQPRHRFKSNKDGRDAEALEFLKANPKMSLRDIVYAMKERGIVRGKSWVSNQRYELMQDGKLSTDNAV
ncbi:MAG TPA: AAA family ATPase [Terriglobales bacterium]|jgi:RecA-family ATPase|nr:AAA family ATPase [Terriglobales bacterium]